MPRIYSVSTKNLQKTVLNEISCVNGRFVGPKNPPLISKAAAERKARLRRALANGWDPDMKEAQRLVDQYLGHASAHPKAR